MMSYRNKILLTIISLISLLSCNGQVKSTHTQNESKEIGTVVNELDNQIWAIFQDSKENYWFGSNGNGIYKFDGKTIFQFTTKDSLIDNQIRGIQEDGKENIYIETPKGVSKFDGTKFTTLKIIKSLDNEWVLEPNDLWFNCNGNAKNVYRYDGKNLYELNLPKQDTLNINETADPYTVFAINKDKNGNIWFGTVLAGAFRFDGKSFLWIGEKELSRLPDGREPGVRSILEDNDGNIWLSNFKSKYKINESLGSYEKIKAVYIPKEIEQNKILYFNSGMTDKEGNLWMTTYGGGVWKYDGKSLSNTEIHNGVEDVLLISIYQDKNGTIWLGTNNDGVYKLNGEKFEKFEPKIKAAANIVYMQ